MLMLKKQEAIIWTATLPGGSGKVSGTGERVVLLSFIVLSYLIMLHIFLNFAVADSSDLCDVTAAPR